MIDVDRRYQIGYMLLLLDGACKWMIVNIVRACVGR